MQLKPISAALLEAEIALCQLRARHPKQAERMLELVVRQLSKLQEVQRLPDVARWWEVARHTWWSDR